MGVQQQVFLLGGLRASAQMISYELALGLSIVGVLMMTGSLRLNDVVEFQSGYWGFIPKWNVLTQPLGFVLFMIAAFAETNRLPFDLAEAEQELVAGYHTEYSSMKFTMFYMAEYANMVTSSALIVTLFFGGWNVPWIISPDSTSLLPSILKLLSFVIKQDSFFSCLSGCGGRCPDLDTTS